MTRRTMVSPPPPGRYGITTVTGRVGHSFAETGAAPASARTTSRLARRARDALAVRSSGEGRPDATAHAATAPRIATGRMPVRLIS